MGKVIVTETIIHRCYDCEFSQYVLSWTKRAEAYLKDNNWQGELKCTRKRPHKVIPDNSAIPEWCPLPDKK